MSIEEEIEPIAIDAIREKVFPGCVVGVVYKNGERKVLPFGSFTYEEGATSVTPDSIYDVASVTKSIPTASLALQLIDEGRLKLADKLIDYIPEFRNSDRENVLIKHLLTYTIDGYGLASAVDNADGKSLSNRRAEDLIETLMTHDFKKRPGEVFKYTNIPAALLGLVIEKITGDTLDNLAQERFFKPLNMAQSTHHPETLIQENIVPTEFDDWRSDSMSEVRGVVHDESAYICYQDGRAVGHAGLFTTAPDILNFLEMLLNDGVMDNKRYFSEEILSKMETNQIEELDDFTGLGWELNQKRYMGDYCTENTFGKTGFTGTLCICDRKKGVAYVILSNRIYPQRPKDSLAINAFRKKIGEILLK
ncbi:hypothetical protein COB52_01680 [Candidatus Kaiserbacteria bacterium]|nr:MAG: hypothetical protein COB52_01680 [Candidatus Kaiserbacteria bacterium]